MKRLEKFLVYLNKNLFYIFFYSRLNKFNMSDKQSEEVKKEEEEKETETTNSKETELPPEVDAFFKGKNKYKHPYGDWKPVVKADPLKRFVLVFYFSSYFFFSFSKTFGDQLDLPADNWYLPENQIAPVIQEIKDDSHVKLVFKEREITGLPSSSSSKANETAVFKKRKIASNRQLRGSNNKDRQKKDDVDES
jgi:hypothetical protein